MSATELLEPEKPKAKLKDKAARLVKRVRDTYRQLRDKAAEAANEIIRKREAVHER
jgi:ElaB/YqjD/DUF883 family membrane-anchored ribosome-binding protein